MATMRAVAFRRYGPAEVLEEVEVPRPEPGRGEVLIRSAAAGVNPADCALRGGQLRLFARLKLPFVPGSDVAGVVEAVGDGVSRFAVGDTVFAMTPSTAGGCYAEYVAVDEENAARVPEGLALAEAGAVPLASLTALQALRDVAGLKAGEGVLIHGASGGVGTFAVQIAKAMGARVTAVCSGRNAGLVRDLGADEVLDYEADDPGAGGRRFDRIFGAVNVLPLRSWRRVLKAGGSVATVNPVFAGGSPRLLARLATGVGPRGVFVKPSGADLETMAAWISAGSIRPVVEHSYPIQDAAQAHRRSETKRTRGKLVLVVDEALATRRARRAARPEAV